MHQALNAVADFNEHSELQHLHHLAEHARADRRCAVEILPRVGLQLFHPQGDAPLFGVNAQDDDVNFVADRKHFGDRVNMLPRNVGDVQQAENAAAYFNKRAVFNNGAHGAFDLPAFVERRGVFAVLGFQHLFFQQRAARNNDAAFVRVDFHGFELLARADERCGVGNRKDIHQRPRQKGANVVAHHRKAALDAALDDAFNDAVGVVCFLDFLPRLFAARVAAREQGVAPAVVQHFQFNFNADFVAGVDFNFAVVGEELLNGHARFGLQHSVGVQDVKIPAALGDGGGDVLALAHGAFLYELFKAPRKLALRARLRLRAFGAGL